MNRILVGFALLLAANAFALPAPVVCSIFAGGEKVTEIEVKYEDSFHSELYEYEFDSDYIDLGFDKTSVRISSQYQLIDKNDTSEDPSQLVFTMIVSQDGDTSYELLELGSFEDLKESNKLETSGITAYCNP